MVEKVSGWHQTKEGASHWSPESDPLPVTSAQTTGAGQSGERWPEGTLAADLGLLRGLPQPRVRKPEDRSQGCERGREKDKELEERCFDEARQVAVAEGVLTKAPGAPRWNRQLSCLGDVRPRDLLRNPLRNIRRLVQRWEGPDAAAWCSWPLAYASDALTPFAEDCVISWMPPGIPTLQAQPWTPRLQLRGLKVISAGL
ncbi:hypothetical protein MDA_GLEAN10006405 [Myotis davidii]|uniref:Uncharacterized protein n=1 Tax=Myotis davidii TaxID=225400 RepID=L5LWI0_MYODS|nr:hypothetical protein MDA_GLEAN10006405 [Myotis davidii]